MFQSTKISAAAAILLAIAIMTPAPVTGSGGYSLTVSRSGDDGFRLVFELNTYHLEETAGDYTDIRISGCGANLNPGQPDLPLISRAFALPGGLKAELRINAVRREFIENIRVAPVKDREGAIQADPNIYSSDAVFPNAPASISSPVIAGKQRIAALNLHPFRFHPGKNRLEVVRRMEVDVVFQRGGGENPKIRLEAEASAPGIEILNPSILPDNQDDFGYGAYLFIIPDSAYLPFIQRLVDWKRVQGFPAAVAAMRNIGTTAEDLKQYLSNAYYNWETPPEYVVLCGDVDGLLAVPSFEYVCGVGDTVFSDHEYTLLEGEDYFSDLNIGRLSVRSVSELNTAVRKILLYEAMPFLSGTEWLGRALLIADTSALQSHSLMEWAKGLMEDYGYSEVNTVYYFSYMPTAQTQQFLDRGVGIVDFRGWADWGGFSLSHIYGLNNGNMTPLVIACAPGANSIQTSECMGEAWLRAGSTSGLRGAVGCIGPSSENTWSRYDAAMNQGLIWGLYHESIYRAAPLMNRGKMEMWLTFPFNRGAGTTLNSVECYFHVYNLIGDPGLSLRSLPPENISVRHQRSIPLEQNGFEIIASASQMPLKGAHIVIHREGETAGSAYTNSAGGAVLNTIFTTPGEMILTAARRDYTPYMARIPIVTGRGQITCVNVLINDDSLGFSRGNGDGLINPGETVELTLSLRNYGPQAIGGVSARLSSPNPLITFQQNHRLIGTIPSGAIGINAQPFVMTIDPVLPDSMPLDVRVVSTDNSGRFYYSQCPLDAFTSAMRLLIISFPQIAPDTLLSPGDSSEMVIEIMNSGHLGWERLTCYAFSGDTGLVFDDSVSVFPACEPDSIVSNRLDPLHFSIDDMMFFGLNVPITLVFQLDGGWSDTALVAFTVGIPTSFDPVPPSDGYGYYCFDDGDVAYDNSPAFEWREIDPNHGGSGTRINLTDNRPNTGDRRVIMLPTGFTMAHYGQSVNRITVCSNGWLSCGETSNCEFRNKPIPSAGAPLGIIAPFWDDLVIGSDGGVYYYHDTQDSAFIIEWSRTENAANGNIETFEVIIWDAAAHPTPTGDSPLCFLYDTVSDVDYFYNWSSVGISNHQGDAGLQYLFSSIYTPGADILENSTALLFTTDAGARVMPPSLFYRPDNFTFTLQTGGMDSDSLFMVNVGEANLNYELSVALWAPEGRGGPDQYGYIWVDSDENIGRNFNWVDITQTGSQIYFPHNDSTSAPIPFGFDFNFYGNNFSSIIVSANGWLSFTSHSSAYNNRSLPSFNAPENLIAPFWDDLDPLRGSGQVFYWVNNSDSIVISFINVERWNTSASRFTFQAILEREGNITLQYLSMSGTLNSATIGIQNASRNIGLQICFDRNYVHNGLRIDILKPWLTLNRESGTITGGDTAIVTVNANAGGFLPGIYRSDITLTTNDPNNLSVLLPSQLTVTTSGDAAAGLTISFCDDGARLRWKGEPGFIYNIYRSSTADFEPGKTIYICRTEYCEYIDRSVKPGETYFYRVTADSISPVDNRKAK